MRTSATRYGRLLFAACVVTASGAVPGTIPETPQFRRIGVADGLPSEDVYALAQDAAGHVWVGTGDGLARFDGVSFQVFRHAPDEPGSLPANTVQALEIDAADRLWVGLEGGGLVRFDSRTRRFEAVERGVGEPALADVWALAAAPDGALWFGGFGGGVRRLEIASGRVDVFRHSADAEDTPGSDHVLALAVDETGGVWIGGARGLDRRRRDRFERHPPGPGGPSGPLVLGLAAESGGRLWIGSSGGLDLRDVDGTIAPAPQRVAMGSAGVTAALRDRDGSLWFASRSGLYRARGQSVEKVALGLGIHAADPTVLDLLEDHEGGLWIATLGGGLMRLAPGWRSLAVLRPNPGREGALRDVPVAVAEAEAGGLWVADSRGAIGRLDLADGRWIALPDIAALAGRRIWSLLEDGRGGLWIGFQGGLAHRQAGGAYAQWPADSDDGPPSPAVDLLLADGNGGLWLSAGGGGIEHRDAEGRRHARWTPDGVEDWPNADTEQMALDAAGALWLAGAYGLRRIDPADGALSLPSGIAPGPLHALAFAADGSLWVQRLAALEQYRVEGGALALIRRVDAGHGLPAVAAGGLQLDRRGDPWLSTPRGLFRFDVARDRTQAFGVRDGLPSQGLGTRPPLRLRQGLIAAISGAGLVLFDPLRMARDPVLPRLAVERLSVRRGGASRELDTARPAALRHDDSELALSVRLLSFGEPAAHRYRFRLDGFDPDWVDAGASGERSYPRLPPGHYVLRATASAGDGVWAAPPLAFPIEVAPPWWATPWARGVLALAIGLLLLAGWRIQRARLQARHAAQLAARERQWALDASAAKSTFLATLGHEIRTPMTGVLGMAELLLRTPLEARQRRHAEGIDRAGRLLLRLVDDALDLARIEAGHLVLDEAPFDLAAVLEAVDAHLAPLADAKGLRYASRRAAGLPRGWRGDALRLQQILLNLGGNAVKFTERGAVVVEARPTPGGGLRLQVRDSGPGLDGAQQSRLFARFSQADGEMTRRRHGGSGLGLAICRELVAAMGGTIGVDSAPGAGATFWFELPLAPCALPLATPPTGPSITSQSLRLLLVEDDPAVAEVVVGQLEALGHRAVHAAHALEALGMLAAERCDAAFLDLDLPGMDGLALARLLRDQGRTLPLLALTARSDPAAEDEARAAGFDAFLRKPASLEGLARGLGSVIPCRPAQADGDRIE